MNTIVSLENKYIIRDSTAEDYPALATLNNLIFPEHPETEEEIRFWDDTLDKTKYLLKRYSVDSKDQKNIASAYYKHEPEMFHPQKFWFFILVHPDYQRQGIGTALYDLIIKDLNKLNCLNLKTWVKEDKISGVSFVTKLGFKEIQREWESRLSVQDFDSSKFESSLTNAYNQGIAITTLKEEMENNPDYQRLNYELDNEIFQDVPLADTFTPQSFEEYLNTHLKNLNLIPEAYFIAKDGDKYVGRSSLYSMKASTEDLYQGLTGVRREYRRKGYALALKVKAIKWAKEKGYKTIITGNDSTNVGMLSINNALGFKRQPAWIIFGKDL